MEIHILSKAAVNIKPSTKRRALCVPVALTMYKANRLCISDFSRPLDNIKAPISNKITWLPNEDAASRWVITPASGKATNGIKDVAGIGKASVAHNIAVKRVMADVQAIASGCPSQCTAAPKSAELIRAKGITETLMDMDINLHSNGN